MTITMKNRTVIYGRVSDDKDGRSKSVPQQIEELQNAADRHGLHVVRILDEDEGISASKYARKERKDWPRLIAMIEAGEVDIVALWEQARAMRDLAVYAGFRDLCERKNVLWLTPEGLVDPADDGHRLGSGVRALLDEQHSRDTSKRVKRAVGASARAGKPHGRHQFGYQRIYGPSRELVAVEIVEEEAAVLRRAANEVLAGRSLRSICRGLALDGIPSPGEALAARLGRPGPTNSPWETRTLRRVLLNPSYAGKRIWKGEHIGDTMWPPIWSSDVALRLAEALQPRGPYYGGKLVHYLSGLAECGECQGLLRVLTNPKRGDKPTYTCFQPGCFRVSILKESLEGTVTGLVLTAVADRRFLKTDRAAVERLQGEAALLRGRLDEALQEAVQGRLSASLLGRLEDQITKEIADIDRQIVGMVGADVEIPHLDVLADRWETLPAEQRRAITRMSIGRVVVRTSNRRRAEDPLTRLVLPDLRQP